MGSTFLSKNELAVKGNSYVGYLFQYKGRLLFSFYLCLAVWAMKKWYRDNDRMTARMNELLQRLHEEFGWTTKLLAALFGRYIRTMLQREEKRLARGWVYEPASFYEKNAAAIALENEPRRHPKIPMLRKRWVAGEFYPQPASYPIRRQSWK